jgi:hypothetical protein
MPLLSDVVGIFLGPVAVLITNWQFLGCVTVCHIQWDIGTNADPHTAHVRLLVQNLFSVCGAMMQEQTSARDFLCPVWKCQSLSLKNINFCKFILWDSVSRGCLWRVSFCLLLAALVRLLRHCSKWTDVIYVKWICFEAKRSEGSYGEVTGDKCTMLIMVTLYWGYLIVLWLFHLVCVLYCGWYIIYIYIYI